MTRVTRVGAGDRSARVDRRAGVTVERRRGIPVASLPGRVMRSGPFNRCTDGPFGDVIRAVSFDVLPAPDRKEPQP